MTLTGIAEKNKKPRHFYQGSCGVGRNKKIEPNLTHLNLYIFKIAYNQLFRTFNVMSSIVNFLCVSKFCPPF